MFVWCYARVQDLKPSNLLFSFSGCLKLGDFGLARIHSSNDPTYSHEVATRWYRSPELLFGARKYGAEVDMWAVGAIFYELLSGGAPLFAGQNDIDQLYRVLKVTGSPSAANWPDHQNLPDWGKIDFPTMEGVPIRTLVHEETDEHALDLLEVLLTLNPATRITATQAKEHKYFEEVRTEKARGAEGTGEWHEEALVRDTWITPCMVTGARSLPLHYGPLITDGVFACSLLLCCHSWNSRPSPLSFANGSSCSSSSLLRRHTSRTRLQLYLPRLPLRSQQLLQLPHHPLRLHLLCQLPLLHRSNSPRCTSPVSNGSHCPPTHSCAPYISCPLLN
jgi:serine/threonine protein kinase